MKISFIGLGQMGKGMAMNLSKCGCDYLVNDVVNTAFEEFEKNKIETTTDLSKTFNSDIIILCLPDEIVVEKILFDSGLVENMGKGKIIVDCSTINYLAALKIAKKVEAKGINFMDAPISGMQSKAEDGTLTIMCGGNEDIFNKVKPYFDLMGSNVLYMGKHGNGQLTKMINNCIYDINCAGIAEMLPMAVKLGLDPEQIGRVVNSGTSKSYASEYFIPRMLERDFSYGFTLKSAYKDLVSATEVALVEKIPTPVLDSTTSIYKMAMLTGYEDLYKGAMICVYEDLLNVKFSK